MDGCSTMTMTQNKVTAKVTKEWLKKKYIKVVERPSKSLDFNNLENL